ncbi:uncharacterized protein N7518_004763 [Penicillium psychrosexuale]|uniref:uncharacterized protein n=1 Tax=Penicillium psychrosexuale TaxID=1002107 RepID=UPI002544F800|nr:uncharacterized protein N7518_004763 [Penicillium psychrosexuale]KAJ5796223.1 hypothetical protein N7518_004763 [Penicillium psychrosexuale]
MASNIPNTINIVDVLPAPSLPTSTTQSTSSRSASGTSRSASQQVLAQSGFWAVWIVVVGLLGGAGFIIWRPASKGNDPENITPKDVIGVDARSPPTNPETPETSAPSTTPKKKKTKKKKKRLTTTKFTNFTTSARNTLHRIKEGWTNQLLAGLNGSNSNGLNIKLVGELKVPWVQAHRLSDAITNNHAGLVIKLAQPLRDMQELSWAWEVWYSPPVRSINYYIPTPLASQGAGNNDTEHWVEPK